MAVTVVGSFDMFRSGFDDTNKGETRTKLCLVLVGKIVESNS